MSDPSCRAFRELLGVYVVGAIEPAERAAVDAHLSQCYECREELAGLAVLPALLHRVPREEAERTAASSPASGEQPADMLNSLLRRVGARRRRRRVKTAFTIAATIVIAVGGAAATTEALIQPPPPSSQGPTELTTIRSNGVLVSVRYARTAWGMTVGVKASGLPQWTRCTFWVVTKTGQHVKVGGWTVGPGANELWYPVQAGVTESHVGAFVLDARGTWGRKVLRIPAA